MFWFWVNTSFIENNYLSLTKYNIDLAYHDKKCEHFSDDFRVEVFFQFARQDSLDKMLLVDMEPSDVEDSNSDYESEDSDVLEDIHLSSAARTSQVRR